MQFVYVFRWFRTYDFRTQSLSKAKSGTTKMNAFSCTFACRWTAWVFALQHRSACFFVLIWRRIGTHFGSIFEHFGTRPTTHPSYTNGPWRISKTEIIICFHAFLIRKQLSSSPRFVDFLKIKNKIQSQKISGNNSFPGHSYSGERFWVFHATSKKAWVRWRFVSGVNIIQAFRVHPKLCKKWRSLDCRCVRRRAKWGQNSGLGRHVIFPFTK